MTPQRPTSPPGKRKENLSDNMNAASVSGLPLSHDQPFLTPAADFLRGCLAGPRSGSLPFLMRQSRHFAPFAGVFSGSERRQSVALPAQEQRIEGTHHETDADQRTQPEERRLAIVDGQKLLDYEIEVGARRAQGQHLQGAVVTRVEPSLEACFVDYGEDRHGFLPFKEISRRYFAEGVSPSQARINDRIRKAELLVQVEKKSAATRARR